MFDQRLGPVENQGETTGLSYDQLGQEPEYRRLAAVLAAFHLEGRYVEALARRRPYLTCVELIS